MCSPHITGAKISLQMCMRAFYKENVACEQQQPWNIFLMSFLADTTK